MKQQKTKRQSRRPLPAISPRIRYIAEVVLFFVLAWLWASHWMGSIFCVAREWSFVAFDQTLMHWLWQQSFGSLWIIGRWLLTLYHWPVVGGLVVALLLTSGSWLVGYCLRIRPSSRWHAIQYVPALFWMAWVAWKGLNLFFLREPGTTLGVLILGVLICAIDAFIIWTFKGKKKGSAQPSTLTTHSSSLIPTLSSLVVIVLVFVIPCLITYCRYPYARPVTKMQVQMLDEDWDGMAATARAHDKLSYRPLAAYYAIALVQNGHLTDALFDIRLDYDTLYIHGWDQAGDLGTNYYLVDCDYHAGLFRAATHKAIEHLTMNGPTIFSLKHLTRLALLDYDWALARKYLFILKQTPFEGDFIQRYEAMLDKPEAVEADPVFARLRKTEPVSDAFEGMFEDPVFLGYNCALMAGRSREALMESLMACLYSKRMPDFLLRCEPLIGSTPPRTISEGLVTQSFKNEEVLKAFPQLKMNAQMYQSFLRTIQPYMKDRPAAAPKLFDQYKGYYPYYYFFGNLKATRKSDDKQHASSNVGVN